MLQDDIAAAVRQCPFLAAVQAAQGDAFARHFACNPFPNVKGPLFFEEGLSSFSAALRLFHGPGGVVPLRRFRDDPSRAAAKGCPYHSAARSEGPSTVTSSLEASKPAPASGSSTTCSSTASLLVQQLPEAPRETRLAQAPFASISLSGFGFLPDPGQLFNNPARAKQKRRPRQQRQQRSPDTGHSSSSASPSSDSHGAWGNSSGSTHRGGVPRRSASSSGAHGLGAVPGSGCSAGGSGHLRGGASAGGAGWKQVLGGLAPLAVKGRHLECPAPIVKMRAALAALKPVRDLRPKALPIRALAMSGAAVAANLPCGAWREHTSKFSPQWFLAVHATVPFVAMLRKAVLMPKWAMLLTLLGSMAGQAAGARLERQRMLRTEGSGSPAMLATHRSDGSMGLSARGPGADGSMVLDLGASCRRSLAAAGAAVQWVLNPVVA